MNLALYLFSLTFYIIIEFTLQRMKNLIIGALAVISSVNAIETERSLDGIVDPVSFLDKITASRNAHTKTNTAAPGPST